MLEKELGNCYYFFITILILRGRNINMEMIVIAFRWGGGGAVWLRILENNGDLAEVAAVIKIVEKKLHNCYSLYG